MCQKDDTISRQAVLKLLSTMPPEEAITKAMLIQNVKYMSAAQPEKRTEERTEKHACDCISRQAAIEAIKEDKIDLTNPNVVAVFKATGDFEKVETQVMTCDRHIAILKDLPSAQLKSYRSYREGYQAGFNEGYQAGFKDAQLEQRWIPCSERLPEEAGWYIASGVRDVGNRWYSTLHGWEEITFRVVAWMPLPEPYKEDDHETD